MSVFINEETQAKHDEYLNSTKIKQALIALISSDLIVMFALGVFLYANITSNLIIIGIVLLVAATILFYTTRNLYLFIKAYIEEEPDGN
jgi:1,4-dihydroxy-2-naphthoate octaprenyltransferase